MQVQTVVMEPPAVLMREIHVPKAEIKTNLDLLNYTLELMSIAEQLNADKRALRAFIEGAI